MRGTKDYKLYMLKVKYNVDIKLIKFSEDREDKSEGRKLLEREDERFEKRRAKYQPVRYY